MQQRRGMRSPAYTVKASRPIARMMSTSPLSSVMSPVQEYSLDSDPSSTQTGALWPLHLTNRSFFPSRIRAASISSTCAEEEGARSLLVVQLPKSEECKLGVVYWGRGLRPKAVLTYADSPRDRGLLLSTSLISSKLSTFLSNCE